MRGIESELAACGESKTDLVRLNRAARRGKLWTVLAAVVGVALGLSASVFAGRFVTKGGGAPVSSAAASASAAPTMTVEEAQRFHKQQHDDSIVRHASEQLDAEWASATSKILGGELKLIAKEQSFHVVDVDCRGTSCVVTLQWPSYDAAFREWGAVLNHAYPVRCGVEVFLDPTEDHASAYRTGVVFECSKSKKT